MAAMKEKLDGLLLAENRLLNVSTRWSALAEKPTFISYADFALDTDSLNPSA